MGRTKEAPILPTTEKYHFLFVCLSLINIEKCCVFFVLRNPVPETSRTKTKFN